MMQYDFSTLNGTDLEQLVCDLLNAEKWKGQNKYKTFREGKDKGIDFLYSLPEKPYYHVGQVKHYYKSGVNALKNTLKNSEFEKVKKLEPEVYIVATSVDLSVKNILDIRDIMHPYIKSLGDIYGKSDINKLLASHIKVHDQHFKLWFSNTEVLKKLLNSNLNYRSADFTEHHIRKRISLYVETKAFSDARNFLKDKRYIIITGEPGIGKTTLAEMLTYEYIKDDYELLYVYDSISEIDNVLTTNDKKQIIYFDDFLGSNTVEINKARGSDAYLNKILRRVKQGKNKLLILTTRKHILSRAIQESEKLKRFSLLSKEMVLNLEEYNQDIRENILSNHIETSELEEGQKNCLRSAEITDFIVNHEHFSPRSVEYVSSINTVRGKSIREFRRFVFESFNNPKEIWEFAYTQQLNEDDRLLLNTLLTFGDEVHHTLLQKAFDARVEYEIKNNNKSRIMYAYRGAFNRLLGSFIFEDESKKIRFINHSLLDFLHEYVKLDNAEVQKIISSVITVDQLTRRLFPMSGPKQREMPETLQTRLLKNYKSFLNDNEEDDYNLIVLAIVIFKYIPEKKSSDTIVNILETIENWQQFYGNYELSQSFRNFLQISKFNDKIYSVVAKNILEILNELVLSDTDFERSKDILKSTINQYNIDLKYLETHILDEHFKEILEEELNNEVDILVQSIYDESQADDLRLKIEDMIKELNEFGINPHIDFSILGDYDWQEMTINHYINEQMLKDD